MRITVIRYLGYIILQEKILNYVFCISPFNNNNKLFYFKNNLCIIYVTNKVSIMILSYSNDRFIFI